MSSTLSDDALRVLDEEVEGALRTGDESRLEVLGYGEISCVVAWEGPEGRFACKRLPPFANDRDLREYTACVEEYLERLAESGVRPLPTEVRALPRDGGALSVYCVQPVSAPESLAPNHLRSCPTEDACELFDAILDMIEACVSPTLGLDGQLSNWVVTQDGLAYLDVSTPLLRDDDGAERLDTELFLASIPWALRGLVRRVFLHQILDKYYTPRGVVLDLLGNLTKECLAHLIEPLISRANRRFEPAIKAEEIDRYYRSDAKMWALLQRLRRLDRFWQRRVRRRVYPFLLPGDIERRL